MIKKILNVLYGNVRELHINHETAHDSSSLVTPSNRTWSQRTILIPKDQFSPYLKLSFVLILQKSCNRLSADVEWVQPDYGSMVRFMTSRQQKISQALSLSCTRKASSCHTGRDTRLYQMPLTTKIRNIVQEDKKRVCNVLPSCVLMRKVQKIPLTPVLPTYLLWKWPNPKPRDTEPNAGL